MPSRRLLAELRAATLESRLEKLIVLRTVYRPRSSNDTPGSRSLDLAAEYRLDNLRRPFTGREAAGQWVSSSVVYYNNRHRNSGIKCVTPHQRHNGDAIEICRQTVVYEQARQRHPR
jgi:putative transposase